jgi:cytochrome c peroxidase
MRSTRHAGRSRIGGLALAITLSGSGSDVLAAPALAPLPDPPKVNEARAELGRLLFFDSRLSGDTNWSCASCHDPAKGWGDGKALADAYTGSLYFRNAPALFNSWGKRYLTWDGRLDGSDPATLVRDMMTEAHTMNIDTRLAQERLKQVPAYVGRFTAAFGAGDPYGGKIYGSIAEYLKTIRTKGAPVDRFLRGDATALDARQQQGMALFTGKAGCVQCHNGPLLSDGSLHVTGVPENPEIGTTPTRQVTMLRHFATMGVPAYMNRREDVGHYVVSKDARDLGRFATPSLWDVGQTAPYMHNGVFGSLAEVVEFYDRGGGERANRSPMLKPLRLTPSEKGALVAFLEALTGERPAVQPPAIPDYELRQHGTN